MAKKVIGNLKLRIPAGRATAGPPVGSTLGQWGLNMMDFINPFNDATKELQGKDVIVHIQVFEDRTFAWKSLGQPVDDLIREKVGIQKGSAKPHTDKVGKITRAQLEEIAEIKKLQAEKASFLTRKQKVEELENKRFEAARIIDTLNTFDMFIQVVETEEVTFSRYQCFTNNR